MRTHSQHLASSLTLALILIAAAACATAVHAQDGTWSRLPATSRVHYHSLIRDPVRDRLIQFGGTGPNGNSNETCVLDQGGDPVWAVFPTPAASRPVARYGHSAVYDPVRDRMLVFGGNSTSGVRNDVWSLSLSDPPNWTQPGTLGTPPPPRWGAAAIYDPVRDRLLIMGGNTSAGRLNDVWELALSGTPTWTQLTPTGTPPSTRWGHSGVYDAVNDRMLVFGGSTTPASNQLWALSLAGTPAWTLLSASGTAPAARFGHAAEYDAANQRMLLFGGYDNTNYLNDAWQLSLNGSLAWASLGALGPAPATRTGAPWVFDAPRNRLLLFGGYAATDDTDDLWTLSLAGTAQWQQLVPGSSAGPWRYTHRAVIDWVGRRMLILQGFTGQFLDDVRAFDLDGVLSWTTLNPLGTRPAARHSHSAIFDLARNRIVVIGGISSSLGTTLNDVWALSLGATPTWTRLTPTGSPPSRISGHAAAYDRVNDRIVCFGGSLFQPGSSSPVWTLSLAGDGHWEPLVPGGVGAPSNTENPTGIYDDAHARMIVQSGAEIWELSLGAAPAWHQRPGLPQALSHASMAYDPARDRALVFGGFGPSLNLMQDTWALPLGTFTLPTLLATQGAPPAGRADHTSVFDPLTNRMIVFGGFGLTDTDVWALTVPGPILDPLDAPPPSRASALQLAPAYPDPAISSDVHIDFTLPQATHASLRVYDVRGRLVRTLLDGTLPAGPQRTRWDRRDAAGLPADAGLYFYELRTARERRTGRVAIIR
ncbi:MAG: kelch repeat-containing protein [Candidatus Eisenbacteria bacterium]